MSRETMNQYGLATFPGVEQSIGASLTLSHGVSPSVATLQIAPQSRLLTLVGPLTLACGDTVLTFVDCRVDSATLVYNAQGMIVRLSLLDRRWRWRYGVISGRYNVWRKPANLRQGRDGGGRDARRELVPGTERTPRQLCALCLDALGERFYDLSGVPNDLRPTVEWNGISPADALAALAHRLGCRIVLRANNTVAVVHAGLGGVLPRGDDVSEMELALAWPDLAEPAIVVCGDNLYQADLPLEAVGQETDGTVRPIDELSYRPKSGWRHVDLDHMNEIADLQARQLAQQTVFRWYRVGPALDDILPDELRPADLQPWQLLPLGRSQLDTHSRDGREEARPAQVFGVWHDPRRSVDFANSAEQLQPLVDDGAAESQRVLVPEPYRLDADRGVVIFPEPLYRLEEDDEGYLIRPARLRLRTSFALRDPATGAAVRYQRRRGNSDAEPARALSHPEIVAAWKVRYDRRYAVSGVEHNLAAVHAEADRYADAVAGQARLNAPESVTYVGLKPIELDGAIQQVTWSVGLSGAMTRAVRSV